MDQTMFALENETLGAYLRRTREDKGITIRDVSDRTRIRTYYIELIENGAFDRLPEGPIGRGFIRAYAECVGIDACYVAKKLDQEVGDTSHSIDSPVVAHVRSFSNPSAKKSPPKGLVPVLAIVFFLVASGTMLWFIRGKTERIVPVSGIAKRIKAAAGPAISQIPGLLNGVVSSAGILKNGRKPVQSHKGRRDKRSGVARKSTQKARPRAERKSVTSPKPLINNKIKPSSRIPRIAMASASGRGVSSVVTNARAFGKRALALKVYALEDTWLRVMVDKKKIEEFLLLAGKEKKWRGSEKFTLTVGNVAGTRVSLNGMKVPLPKNSSNVVRDFVITKKNLN